MNKLFDNANEFIKQCDWHDLSSLKLCLLSIGVLIGMNIPVKKKERETIYHSVAAVVFGVPLIVKFLKIVFDKSEK